jgi:iron complex transport system substrate-binding protein
MARLFVVSSLGLTLLLSLACGAGQSNQPATSAVEAGQSPPRAATTATASTPQSPSTSVATPSLPAVVTDKDGRQVTVTDVSRIIPLNGDIAEVIWALGLGDNVIATDTSATYPEDATKRQRIGYQRQLSAEGILSLRPSVVIGNDAAGPPAVIEQIRGAGVPVVILSSPSTLDGAVAKISSVAAALGVPEQGDQLARRTQTEIEAAQALAAKATSKPRVVFLYVRGGATQQIGGTGTAADALIAAAGAVDAGVEAGIRGFQPLTPEALVAARPDVLLLLTAGLESVGGIDGLLAIPGVAQTPAGRDRRVLHYEDQYLLGLGPRVGQALTDLAKGLHPELR